MAALATESIGGFGENWQFVDLVFLMVVVAGH
jgi:hypothetical protein